MTLPQLGLLGGLLGLVLLGAVTARRPAAAVPDLDGYFTRWAVLHEGIDPRRSSTWLRGWLRMTYRIARPLARRGVHPDVLTLASIWLAAAVLVIAAEGGRWEIAAGWLLVVSGLGDTLDGCVAVLTQRTSRWGYVLDSAVDRVNDVLYLAAAVLVGAPLWVACVAGGAFLLLEYVRARAGNAGAGEIRTITVGERAVRVICCSIAVHWGGVFLTLDTQIATAATAVLAVLSVAGLLQLLIAVRRQLLAPGLTVLN